MNIWAMKIWRHFSFHVIYKKRYRFKKLALLRSRTVGFGLCTVALEKKYESTALIQV